MLVFASGATYAAASTVLEGLANAAADAGVVADVLVHTAPLGYIRDAWRLEAPAESNDGSWSFEAALASARRLRLAAERTGAGDLQGLPTSVGIRQDLTDAADDAYDVALASFTAAQKQAVLRECALMWLAFDERVNALGPDAWVNTWGERPRVRARRQLERCIGFGEDKDCEALLQKVQ